MSYRGPLPTRAIGFVNGRVAALHGSSRWGKLVGKRITLLSYTGRRSGQTFTLPVSYKRDGNVVTIGVQLPDAKKWWRNFVGEGGPLSMELDGERRTGHATARRDDKGRVTVTVNLNA